jgi:hypothetical protein
MNQAKKAIMRILGSKNAGRLEYYFKPHLKTSYGGPFNGQDHRQHIFNEIIRVLPAEAVIETGTCRGTTTEFMSRSGLPIYSVEYDPRLFEFASLRFRRHRNIRLFCGDSRSVLKQLAIDSQVPKRHVLFYLDAHPFNFKDDVPLREEVEFIFNNWEYSVVMIDDFQVPGTDYYFCDYGPGKRFDLEYLAPVSATLSLFFPSAGTDVETRGKSGCVILCREPSVRAVLLSVPNIAIYRE